MISAANRRDLRRCTEKYQSELFSRILATILDWQERIQSAAITRTGVVHFEVGRDMTAGDHYRSKAVEFRAKAQVESDPRRKAEFEHLARAYLRLAEQAERNSHLDITYETPTAKDDEQKSKP